VSDEPHAPADLLDGGLARRLHRRPRGEGGWAAPDAELHRFHNEQARELDLHLLGRRLWEVMTYWETAEERNASAPEHELEFARIWTQLPKLVYSTSLAAVERNTRLSRGDPVQEVQLVGSQPTVGQRPGARSRHVTAHDV
jgi:hypothetical protein